MSSGVVSGTCRWRGSALRWTRRVVEYGLAQGLAQVAGMVAGLIYVRIMPVEQYALFALALSALAVVSVGSDLGVTGSLNYFWRKSLKKKADMGSKIAAVRRLRAILYFSSIVVGGAIFFSATWSHPVSKSTALLCFALVVVAGLLQTRAGVNLQLMRLEGRQHVSYYCESAANVTRLLAALAMLAASLTSAWQGLVGILFGAIMLQTMLVATRSSEMVQGHTIGSEDWQQLRTYLVPLLPSVAVYMITEPLLMWFASYRGGPEMVAEVFALWRIGAVLAIIGRFTYIVLTPQLAQIEDDKKYTRATVAMLTVIAAIFFVILFFVYHFPNVPLLLIGAHYAHLQFEVLISVAASSMNLLASFLVLANRGRGWVALDPYAAMANFAVIIGLCSIWNFDSTANVFWLAFALACWAFSSNVVVLIVGLTKSDIVTIKTTITAEP